MFALAEYVPTPPSRAKPQGFTRYQTCRKGRFVRRAPSKKAFRDVSNRRARSPPRKRQDDAGAVLAAAVYVFVSQRRDPDPPLGAVAVVFSVASVCHAVSSGAAAVGLVAGAAGFLASLALTRAIFAAVKFD